MKGTIKRYNADTFHLIFDAGKDPLTGKRRQKWVTYKCRTEKEAEKELRRLLSELDNGTFVEPSKMTVAQFLDLWLSAVKSQVRPTTHETWTSLARTHLQAGAFGRLQLAKLTSTAIQSLYNDRLQNGRVRGEGGLSPRTVKHLHRLLFQALEWAADQEPPLIGRNPAAKVKPPKVEDAERPVLDEDGIRRLVEGARESWLFLPIVVALSTGMRRGEILGLRWASVDLKAGTLKVKEAAQQTQAHGLAYAPPKSKKGVRAVELPEVLVDALRREKGRQAEIRLQMGEGWQANNLVVCQDDGSPRTPDNLTHAFGKLAKRLGLPDGFTFHDLRHSHATALILAGVPLQAVSERVGHSSVTTTLRHYGHLLPGIQQEAARQADAHLKRAVGGF